MATRAGKQEVRDNTHGPYIDGLSMTSYTKRERMLDNAQGEDSLFLKISGAMYWKTSQRAEEPDRRELTPGVPQTSVSILSLLSGMTRLSPKSAIMISDVFSGLERKIRFSGFRSR